MIYAQVYFSPSLIPPLSVLGKQDYHFFGKTNGGWEYLVFQIPKKSWIVVIVIAGFLKSVSILFSTDNLSAKEPLMDEIVLGEVRLERRGGRCPFGRIGQERIQRIL